jgi:GNAT superfamily N-acetyltransferase
VKAIRLSSGLENQLARDAQGRIMIQSFMEKISDYWREYGARRFISACLIKVKNALLFYEKEVIGCLSISDAAFCSNPKMPVTVRPAQLSDLTELKALTTKYRKRDFLQWIQNHYIFYVAQAENPSSPDIVGYICVCPANKSKHKLISILKLKDSDYWAVDAYINPQYRGKGINAAIASEFLAHAKQEGYKRGFGTILFKNSASRKSYTNIGEKEIGLFTTITILGATFHFLKRNQGYEEFFN